MVSVWVFTRRRVCRDIKNEMELDEVTLNAQKEEQERMKRLQEARLRALQQQGSHLGPIALGSSSSSSSSDSSSDEADDSSDDDVDVPPLPREPPFLSLSLLLGHAGLGMRRWGSVSVAGRARSNIPLAERAKILSQVEEAQWAQTENKCLTL